MHFLHEWHGIVAWFSSLKIFDEERAADAQMHFSSLLLLKVLRSTRESFSFLLLTIKIKIVIIMVSDETFLSQKLKTKLKIILFSRNFRRP